MIFKILTDTNLLDKNSNIPFFYVFCFPSPKSEFKYMISNIIRHNKSGSSYMPF